VASSWAITVAIVYLPFFQGPFHTYAMSLQDWVIVVLAGVSVLVPVEIYKLITARRTRPSPKVV